jgi:hypothetical protein
MSPEVRRSSGASRTISSAKNIIAAIRILTSASVSMTVLISPSRSSELRVLFRRQLQVRTSAPLLDSKLQHDDELEKQTKVVCSMLHAIIGHSISSALVSPDRLQESINLAR